MDDSTLRMPCICIYILPPEDTTQFWVHKFFGAKFLPNATLDELILMHITTAPMYQRHENVCDPTYTFRLGPILFCMKRYQYFKQFIASSNWNRAITNMTLQLVWGVSSSSVGKTGKALFIFSFLCWFSHYIDPWPERSYVGIFARFFLPNSLSKLFLKVAWDLAIETRLPISAL